MANTTVTEITCHAVGVRRQHPEAMTIRRSAARNAQYSAGRELVRWRDFAMNDRWAARTWRRPGDRGPAAGDAARGAG